MRGDVRFGSIKTDLKAWQCRSVSESNRGSAMQFLIGLMIGAAAAASASASPVMTSYTVMGEGSVVVARAVTATSTCPALIVDGSLRPMTVRMPPATLALRTTAMGQAASKASEFAVLTCEAIVPAGARRAAVDGHRLALLRGPVTRIVVIGDTGCRIKGSVGQACNDAAQFPFARIAKHAAAWHPQLVVHVGDYLYRETACPTGNNGCAGSPWAMAGMHGQPTFSCRERRWLLPRRG